MRIPPTPVYQASIEGPGVWRKSDFPDPEQWTYHLRPETLSELDSAIRPLQRKQKGIDLARLTTEDFPLASFAEDAIRLKNELQSGRGFVVIKGLPIDAYTQQEACAIYLGIGSFLGATLPQNVKGEQLYSVRDEGYNISKDYGTVGVRFSKTTAGLHFHTDSAPVLMGNTPDIVGLLALQIAKSGGESAIVSAKTAHNVMLKERPEYLERLYGCYHFDRRAELRPGESPTLLAPVFTHKGSLQVRYFRFYIPKGHEIAGVPLTGADLEPLDFFESVMNREELPVTFGLERGDMQFVNNTFILHSRTAFQDHAEPERRRHLIRLWLKV